MRNFKTIAAQIVVACGASCFAVDFSSTNNVQTLQQAYAELLSIKCFAFGGVGYAGVISEGERAFRTIAAHTNAMGHFKSILTNGSTAGKLYALAGIRKLDPNNFDRFEKSLSAESKVQTMSGCIVDTERTSVVLTRIRLGKYLDYWPGERKKRGPQ